MKVAVDTNVLVRAVVGDDAKQSKAAARRRSLAKAVAQDSNRGRLAISPAVDFS